MPLSHDLTHAFVASQPFTPASSDARMEDLSHQLQLRKVQAPAEICNTLVSNLIQQSTTVGRKTEDVLSAVTVGTARVAANKNGVLAGGRDHDGANASILSGSYAPSNRGSPAHAYAHAGFPRPVGRVGSAEPHDSATPLGYHELYNPNDEAMSTKSYGYMRPTQIEPKGLGVPTSPAERTSPSDFTYSKDANIAGDECLPLESHGHSAPARPPASVSIPGIYRPTDTRGPFGRIQKPNMYPTPDALQDANTRGKSTPVDNRRALTTQQCTSQPSLAATNAVAPGTQATGFVPMLAVSRPDMTGRDVTPMPLGSQAVIDLKFSPHYRGMHTEANASADHLPPDQNCSLWITQLPPDVKVAELLGKIRNVGRVYATVLSPPDGIKHPKSAAKLVFFTPAGARKLLAHGEDHPLVIRGHRAQIMPNRTKCHSQSTERGESRVLIITGHRSFVNEASLTAYFEGRFTFQIDKVQTLLEFQDRAVVEYQFGSYRCQSQMGLKALLLDRPRGLEMVEFGADPCEVGSETTSFTVAGERIQGRGLFPDLE
ncbi:hypothetical protein MAC_02442 [Metarhizium acridum CQMa 102]|uniref:RRM domain-containing protein n=1 Tax=Metarhizium acridum (strain CQMa 102) TaxID=655827 RepID=E9DXU4_METAQ|nr:uncharacterized protein MAC_02442 [Metarhizium acridum CQMa 102]EFY91557.1 hypothetical protein MAC_02442 [Metarhizium acridum CQMa 102]